MVTQLALTQDNAITLTGNLAYDAHRIGLVEQTMVKPIFLEQGAKKKPALAGLFSLFLPGAGQYYNDNYLATGIFVAIEAGLITTAAIYNNKGNKKTDEFQDVANAHWNVVRYAEWINLHKNKNISINPNTQLPAQMRVNWDELNAVEEKIDGFSHKLARYGEQQYYEMIGKYNQFAAGWDQFDPAVSDNSIRTKQFLDYAAMRGKANDYYNYASKAAIGIYLNHVASVVQAVWEAVSHNNNLQVSSNVKTIYTYYGTADYQTNLNIKYGF